MSLPPSPSSLSCPRVVSSLACLTLPHTLAFKERKTEDQQQMGEQEQSDDDLPFIPALPSSPIPTLPDSLSLLTFLSSLHRRLSALLGPVHNNIQFIHDKFMQSASADMDISANELVHLCLVFRQLKRELYADLLALCGARDSILFNKTNNAKNTIKAIEARGARIHMWAESIKQACEFHCLSCSSCVTLMAPTAAVNQQGIIIKKKQINKEEQGPTIVTIENASSAPIKLRAVMLSHHHAIQDIKEIQQILREVQPGGDQGGHANKQYDNTEAEAKEDTDADTLKTPRVIVIDKLLDCSHGVSVNVRSLYAFKAGSRVTAISVKFDYMQENSQITTGEKTGAGSRMEVKTEKGSDDGAVRPQATARDLPRNSAGNGLREIGSGALSSLRSGALFGSVAPSSAPFSIGAAAAAPSASVGASARSLAVESGRKRTREQTQ